MFGFDFRQGQVPGGEKPKIGWDHIARRQANNIARDELLHGDFDEAMKLVQFRRDYTAFPFDAGGRLDHGAELRGRIIGAVLLNEGSEDSENDDHQNHQSRADLAERDRSRTLSGFLIRPHNSFAMLGRHSLAMRFGPINSSLAFASCWVSPSGEVRRSCQIAAGSA
jgi:hypothetical protein